MAKQSNQFAIIDKIKSFVKGGRNLLQKSSAQPISEGMAKKIQETAYEKSLRPIEDRYTPPYLELSKQLQVDNYQIFCAAVFNMANIAVNSSKYRKEIIAIFEKTLADPIRSPEQHEYLNNKLIQLRKIKV